jgi:hypothetical protein
VTSRTTQGEGRNGRALADRLASLEVLARTGGALNQDPGYPYPERRIAPMSDRFFSIGQGRISGYVSSFRTSRRWRTG